jgi:hypothetical protein
MFVPPFHKKYQSLGVLRAFWPKFLKVGDFSGKVAKLGETWVKLDESWYVLGVFFLPFSMGFADNESVLYCP